MLRRFYIERGEDINGKSGTGRVAEGIEFDNGWIAYTWLSPKATVTVTNSISLVEALHSHGGDASNAKIVWIDSITNINRLSLSGRLILSLSDLILSQWPEVAKKYKRVEYAGTLI